MANTGRMTTGTNPRRLQYGLDAIITHEKAGYKGVGSQIFESVPVKKGFYEAMEMAGMGMAAEKGQGEPISADSVDQHWVFRWPIKTYEKGARITMEALADDVYGDLLKPIGKAMAKSMEHNRDFQMAAVLNEAFSTTGPDGKVLCASDHPLQAGGSDSNILSPGLDISENAIEQMLIVKDQMKTPDGLLADYDGVYLVVPTQLQFEACRIMKSRYQSGTANNDVNAIFHRGDLKDYIVWKRLTDSDGFFVTTNAENGLSIAQRATPEMDSWKENMTKDVVVSMIERFVTFYQNYRCVVGNQGAA